MARIRQILGVSLFLALSGVVVVAADATSSGGTAIIDSADNSNAHDNYHGEQYYYNDSSSFAEAVSPEFDNEEGYYWPQQEWDANNNNQNYEDEEYYHHGLFSDEGNFLDMEGEDEMIELDDQDLDRIISTLEANRAIKQRGGNVLSLEEQIEVVLEEKYQRRLVEREEWVGLDEELELVENMANSYFWGGGEFDEKIMDEPLE